MLLVHALRHLPAWPWLAVLALAALPPWRGRAAVAAFVCGFLFMIWHAQHALAQRWPAARHAEEHWVQGVVASLPAAQPALDRDGQVDEQTVSWRFLFEPDDEARAAGLPSRLRVSWHRSEADLRGGACWRLKLRVRTPHGSLNPGSFDYEAWLLRQGVGATASVREGEPCATPAGYPVLKARQALVSHLQETLGETPGAALLIALALGDTSGLRAADWNVFRLTGTTHLVAISGFNLAIVAGFAFLWMRWLWSAWPRLCLIVPAQRVALFGSALVAIVYALLAGFEPPIARALFMLLVLTIAAAVHRLDEPSRALAWAWLLILLVDPFAVLSPGLWLSFGAVAAIFYLSVGRWRVPTDWRLAVRLQLFLSLILAPLTLYYFHGFAWASPLVNLIAVPVFAVLTPLLLLAVLLSALPGPGGWVLMQVAHGLALAQDGLTALATTLPQPWWPGSPPLAALALAVIGSVLLFAPRGLPLRALGLLCWLPLFFPPRPAPPGGLELAALDVGQGLAVVVHTTNHTLLFDTGPAFDEGFDAGESVVAPYLLGRGIRDIDLLLVSHGDNDHAGGVAAVRRLLRVKRELGTDQGEPCRDGQRWEWDGVRFELLHPDRDHWSSNNSSCVLRIDGAFSVLLPGDVERVAERRLVREHADHLRAEVLLTPHHGSRSSSTPLFVDAVQPAVVIHTAGWRSHYRHPRPEVVDRYAEIGARQFTTGVSGMVRVWRDERGVLQVETWRERAARWWNAAAAP
ncbi:MAG TPA: DNA internalization-related competence protein ComEC/Rec2 [Solimonas sp.]